MNKRATGKKNEEIAAAYLIRQGYTILATNYHCRYAELDIVARESGGCLCFIEVKYRKDQRYEAPIGVITKEKMRKNSQAALFYLKNNHLSIDTPIRFDVVIIIGTTIKLYPNAFEFQY